MAAQKEKEQRFDQVKLQGMHEPLTVRVEKIRGNVRQPIELPPKGSEQTGFSPPGTGWTRDEVLQLENFILTKWAGGGYYEFTVNDAKGERMMWQSVWDPRMYPEKVPPNTAEAAIYGAAPTAPVGPQPVPAGVQPLGMQPQSGWPSGALSYNNNPPHTGPIMAPAPTPPAPVAPPAPTPQPSQAPPMWMQQQPWGAPPNAPWMGQPYGWQQPQGFGPQGFPQNYGPQGFGPQSYGPQGYGPQGGFGGSYGSPRSSRFNDDDDARARRARFFDDDEKREAEKREAEKRDLENKLRQAELNQKELEYKSTLERIQQQQAQALQQMQQQHAQQMQQMQDELRRIGEGRGKGEDEEVRRMREQQQQQREQAQLEQQRQREQAAAEKAALEQRLHEQQLAQLQAQSSAQVAQLQAQSNAQVQALRDQLARLAETPKGETDEFRRLREEQDKQAREFERARQEDQRRLEAERAERERERERHERERREEALQREMKEAREATERRFEQLMASRNQSDPMIDALKETSRMNAESMREMARMQQANSDKMSAFMVAPAQLAAIMKDNNNGADGVMRGMIQSIGEIGNLYKGAAEAVLQMSGGGGEPPAVRLIQEGIGRASEVAERFLAVKRDSVLSEAKIKTAEAARDQTKIQAEAALRAQAMHAQAQAQAQAHARQAGWSPPPPVANANSGLGGAQQQARPAAAPQQPRPNGNGQAHQAHQTQPTQGPIDVHVEPEKPRTVGPIDLPPEPPPPPNSTGPSEEEMFGMALESVNRLRRGVAAGTLTPEKTIDAILQGVEHVVTNNLVIPAFVLFQQERWADFIDVMLPAAPQTFKDECVRILIEEVEPGDPNEPGDAS